MKKYITAALLILLVLGCSNQEKEQEQLVNQIPVYEYVDGEMRPVSYCVPHFISGNLVWVKMTSLDKKQQTNSVTFLEEMREYLVHGGKYAIIYDRDNCYLYYDNQLVILHQYGMFENYRSLLPGNYDFSLIELSEFREE